MFSPLYEKNIFNKSIIEFKENPYSATQTWTWAGPGRPNLGPTLLQLGPGPPGPAISRPGPAQPGRAVAGPGWPRFLRKISETSKNIFKR